MDVPEPSWSHTKRDTEDNSDMKFDRAGDEEDWEGSDKKKHRSSKSRKNSNAEETDELDSCGRRKSIGDGNEIRKRSSGSSRAGSGDEDNHDTRKEHRSKQLKKSQDDRAEKKSSNGFPDRESSRKDRDTSGSKGHLLADESERSLSRKPSLKPSVPEDSQSKSRSKVDSPRDGKLEKMQDRGSRNSDRKENSREKNRGSREQERNPRRRWDESDSTRKTDESNYMDKSDSKSGKNSNPKHGSRMDRTIDARDESSELKSKVLDSHTDTSIKFSIKEEKRIGRERSKSRGRIETQDEDTRPTSTAREDRSSDIRDDKHRIGGEKLVGLVEVVESSAHRSSSWEHSEKIEKHRQQFDPTQSRHEITESRERYVSTNEAGIARIKDRSGRKVRHSKRSPLDEPATAFVYFFPFFSYFCSFFLRKPCKFSPRRHPAQHFSPLLAGISYSFSILVSAENEPKSLKLSLLLFLLDPCFSIGTIFSQDLSVSSLLLGRNSPRLSALLLLLLLLSL